jgi:hypothetical protein
MTIHEYENKSSKVYSVYGSEQIHYIAGLSAGIELAKEWLDWAVNNGFIKDAENNRWVKTSGLFESVTTSELFEIFLTERNEK